ncbi:RAB32 [Mytilus coruscus]|uniref:RAB32 n=1 Tax=Mytilus coruscus TaxID=42192 RepID=A0A6J8CGZ7_MYTCO|nr:RAB32 [Mytilus coruscus]
MAATVEKKELLYKFLVIGDIGTGKTSIKTRYAHNLFSEQYRATIGVDFALKVINWDDDTVVRLQLWDIAVFDVTKPSTFEAVTKWKADLDSKVTLPDSTPVPCVLLANKCDQAKEGPVNNVSQMDDFCKENGFVGWFETSAKENINIDEAARFLVTRLKPAPPHEVEFSVSKSKQNRTSKAAGEYSKDHDSSITESSKRGESLLHDINSKLEIRRKSIELDGIDPLEKEAFEQTVIYAAKTALRVIKSARLERSETCDNVSVKSENQSDEDDYSEIINDYQYTKRNSKEKCITNFEEQSSRPASKNRKTRRQSSVHEVNIYKKMAEKKKSIRRKESYVLLPLKDVKGLTQQQIDEIKKSFNDLDVNKDGRVSKRELILGAYRLGMNPTDAEVDEMFKSSDKNNDGFIDFNEYVEMMRKNYVTIDIERERMKAAFCLLDSDGDGLLTRQELISALCTKQSGITVEDIDEILHDADMDGNEQIDFNEFVDSTICAKLF